MEPASQVFPGGYERIKEEVGVERIFHVHLKDPVTTGEGVVFTEFGKGEIDYRGSWRRWSGTVMRARSSMETHWRRRT